MSNSKQENGVPERLKKIRNDLNLNQKEASERIGVTKSYWSALERGNRELTGNLLRKLIVEFKVSADWLLTGGKDSKAPNSKSKSTLESIDRQVDGMYMNVVWLIELMEKSFGKNPAYDKYLKGLQETITSANNKHADLDTINAGLSKDFFELFNLYFLNMTYPNRRKVDSFNPPQNVIAAEV